MHGRGLPCPMEGGVVHTCTVLFKSKLLSLVSFQDENFVLWYDSVISQEGGNFFELYCFVYIAKFLNVPLS